MLPLVQILRPDGTIADMEKFLSLNLGPGFYKKLYRLMILTRLLDREGRLLGTTGRRPDKTDKNTLFIGPYGQEAAEIASAMVLPSNAWVLAYTRSFGAAIGRGVSPKSILRFFAEAKADEFIHDLLAHRVHRFYTAVGIHLSHAEGISHGAKLQGEIIPAAAYFGDGATSEGFFHEALNWASIYQVPVLFFCENNQWAISTPTSLNRATSTFAERALGYGMDFEHVDGNDPLAVIWATQRALKRAHEESRSTLVEFVTYRLGPHTTAAGAVVEIPEKEMERATREDPLSRLQHFLLSPNNPLGVNWEEELLEVNQGLFEKLSGDPAEAKLLYKDTHLELRREDAELIVGLNTEIRQSSEEVLLESLEVLTRGKELVKKSEDYHAESRVDDFYKNLAARRIKPRVSHNIFAEDAIPLAVYDALSMDRRVVYFGQDVAEAGGVMRTTALRADLAAGEKFIQKVLPDWESRILHRRLPLKCLFPNRIFNAPLDESGLVGSGLGLTLNFDMQLRPIVEMQFSGFGRVGCAQLDEWSRMLHRYAGLPEIKIPGVIIMPFGGGKRIEYHRENEIPLFINNPGFIIICPSTPQDFYDMLIAAIASDKPVLYFSHLELYRHPKIAELIRRPPSKPIEEFGIRIAREGENITVVSYGRMVHECLAVAEELAKENISVEILDLRVLSPLKREVIVKSVAKTGRLVTIDEGPLQGNIGAEIAAIAAEEKESILSLSAPVCRVGSPRTLWPSSKFWTYYIPQREDIKKAILNTVNFK